MKILFATSEAVPFIKSGGLADVAGSLTKAVRNRQHACRVVMPLYEDLKEKDQLKFVTSFQVQLGWRSQYCGVFETTVSGVKYYFIDNEYYFKRHGLYGFYDEAERFGFFSNAVLEMIRHIDFKPDIIHCNDWQTALVPVFLNAGYRNDPVFENIKTVFTIHNIQYQGIFDTGVRYDILGLGGAMANSVEYNGASNFMKGGIEQCDALTTVSPTYATEILDPWFAHGLDDVLRGNQQKLTGILNGIDYNDYDPGNGGKLMESYSADSLDKKLANKRKLQHTLDLNQDDDTMVIGIISRLVEHKGVDLIKASFERLMELNVQVVLLGAGDWQYERFFRETMLAYPHRVSVTLGFDENLARKIYGAADVFLMPSKSEPCGLAQMISLRYGTIPIVRETGGLRDSISDFGGENGNGYTFLTYNAEDMLDAVCRAYHDFADKEKWTGHMQHAMKCDFSWGKSAQEYIALYKRLVG